jgi:hypothetical protein
VVLLTVRGMEELSTWPLRLHLRLRPDPLAALGVVLLLCTLLLVYDFGVYMPVQIPMYQGYNFTSAASLDAVKQANIHHALVFVASDPSYDWWLYGSVFPANSPMLDGDIVYARDRGAKDFRLTAEFPGRATYRLDGTVLKPFTP